MTEAQTKTCQNCKQSFTIEPEDFGFYERIKVPPPTFCPGCRLQRRMSFRNERTLYKRSCDLCGVNIIAMYPEGSTFPVYCNPCWWGDKWDSGVYAKNIDFSRGFLEQVGELLKIVPRAALIGSSNVNCDYVNYSAWLKNSYLLVGCANLEDSAYCYRSFDSKSVFDCFSAIDSQSCSETNYCIKSYETNSSEDCENSINGMFLSGCRNVSNCLGSVNLRNAKNVIFNKQVDESEFKQVRERLGLYSENVKFKEKYSGFKINYPYKYARNVLNTDSTGDYLNQDKNCKNCFVIRESENLKYCIFGSVLKDSYDISFCDNSSLVYESSNIEQNYMKLFSLTSWFSKEITYCDTCFSSSNLFGCVGMRDKSYSILNKQYAKEEYEKLVPQIIDLMSSRPYLDGLGAAYRYGEFFPSEMSPFYYNETIAQEYFPLDKAVASRFGFRWKEQGTKNYKASLDFKDLPDDISETDESILEKTISCEHAGNCDHQCSSAFRVIPSELQFYKKENIPLPRTCPNCRHYSRSPRKNPLQLWLRKCQCKGMASDNGKYQNIAEHSHGSAKCLNEFETGYSPDRPEIVYCEACYNAEVA